MHLLAGVVPLSQRRSLLRPDILLRTRSLLRLVSTIGLSPTITVLYFAFTNCHSFFSFAFYPVAFSLLLQHVIVSWEKERKKRSDVGSKTLVESIASRSSPSLISTFDLWCFETIFVPSVEQADRVSLTHRVKPIAFHLRSDGLLT